MVKIIFEKVVLWKIGDVGRLHVGNVGWEKDTNVHCGG